MFWDMAFSRNFAAIAKHWQPVHYFINLSPPYSAMQVPTLFPQRACRLIRSLLALMLLSILTLPVMGNDAVFYASGNQLIPWSNNDVKVQKEILTIRLLNDEEAEVDVYYEFYLPKDSATLTVGFEALPPERYDDDFELSDLTSHPYMHDFSVEMNGKNLPYEFATVVNDSSVQKGSDLKFLDLSRYEFDDGKFSSGLFAKGMYDLYVPVTCVYFFQAHFVKGINRVRHRYTYRINASQAAHYQLDYKLSPALRWANHQIDDFTLRIETQDQGMHFFLDKTALQQAGEPVVKSLTDEGVGKYRGRHIHTIYPEREVDAWEFSLRNAVAEFHAVNYRPADELYITAADFSKSGTYEKYDAYNLFYEGRTSIEERAFKHLKQAEAGERFKDKKLQQYFDGWWWYMPKKK